MAIAAEKLQDPTMAVDMGNPSQGGPLSVPQGASNQDLASGTSGSVANNSIEQMSGLKKAAVVLLALGDEYGKYIWTELEDEEIRAASIAMAKLGAIDSRIVEEVLMEFVSKMSSSGAVIGSMNSTEQLLNRFLPDERVAMIMEELRGPSGRTMWDKISNVQEETLANYLKNEYPQTIAVVLSKIRPDNAARVLALFTDELAMDVVHRILAMETVQKDILERVEATLRSEFMTNLYKSSKRDPYEQLAEIFNNFDRTNEVRFISQLEDHDEDAAERVKQLMFTFEDLARLDNASLQTLLRKADAGLLPIALKGASDSVREVFYGNLSRRVVTQVREDIEVMGPKRMKDIEEAQSALVSLAKELGDTGEIIIAKSAGNDEIVV